MKEHEIMDLCGLRIATIGLAFVLAQSRSTRWTESEHQVPNAQKSRSSKAQAPNVYIVRAQSTNHF